MTNVPERRGRIVGSYGGLAGLAVAAGPIVGGVVAERLDWHWIFWLNVAIGLIALALGTRLLPESHGAPERLDLVGVTLVSSGVAGLVWALVCANDIGWSSPEILGTSIAIASAVFAAHGHLGNPAAVTAGFRPALWSCVIFAVLAALTAIAITARPSGAPANTPAADVPVAA